MTAFNLSNLRISNVWTLFTMRERIELAPDYQRQSEIWNDEKRKLLIDTVINRFDVPKLYLHKFPSPVAKKGKTFHYAIVDGKQRLETMWNFINGGFALADDFEYFADPSVKAGGMTYDELGKLYPTLKADFDGFPLDVVCIETADIEMIEEMFSRLNEAVPLSAPEKRNAFGGPLPTAIRTLAAGKFFRSSLPFANSRYRHFDLAVKFLFAEHTGKVMDTKKAYLDQFVKNFADKPRNKIPAFFSSARQNTKLMATVFSGKDSLLRSVGMVTIYYHLFRLAYGDGWGGVITRSKLLAFEKLREENRKVAEKDIASADYELIEFDRYAQSPNDAYAVKLRLSILLKKAFKRVVKIDDL